MKIWCEPRTLSRIHPARSSSLNKSALFTLRIIRAAGGDGGIHRPRTRRNLHQRHEAPSTSPSPETPMPRLRRTGGGRARGRRAMPSERTSSPEPCRERQRPHPLGDAANGGGTPCHTPNHPFNLHQNTPCEFAKSPSARCSAAPDGATSWCHARRNRGRRDPHPCPGAVKRHLFSRRPHHGLLASGSSSSL